MNIIKNDLKVINNALLSEVFQLDTQQIMVNTLKINSNKNLNITSQNNFCSYKLNCFENLFNDFEIYFNNIYSILEDKQNLFNLVKETSFQRRTFQEDIDNVMSFLNNFYRKNDFVKELFDLVIGEKSNTNFGMISNYIHNKILQEDHSRKNHLPLSFFNSDQEIYHDLFNQELLSVDNLKKYLMINFEDFLDENTDEYNNNFDLSSYLCQNFINISRSMFTLHSGTFDDFSNEYYLNPVDQKVNMICPTSESKYLNFNDYVSNNKFFDYENFYKNEIKNYYLANENKLERVNKVLNENSEPTTLLSSQSSDIHNPLTRFSNRKNLNIKSETLEVFNNKIRESIENYIHSSDKMYSLNSKIENNIYKYSDVREERKVDYFKGLKEFNKSFENIYDLDWYTINENKYKNLFLNKWIFYQSFIVKNKKYESDIDLTNTSYYDSVSWENIQKRYGTEEDWSSNEIPPDELIAIQEEAERLFPSLENSQVGQGKYVDRVQTKVNEENKGLREQYIADRIAERGPKTLLDKFNEYANENNIDRYVTFGSYNNETKKNELMTKWLNENYYISPNSIAITNLNFNMHFGGEICSFYYGKDNIYKFLPYEPMESISDQSKNDFRYEKDYIIRPKLNKSINYFTLKVDSIVKKTKILALKNSNVNTQLIDEVTKKINQKTTENLVLAYSDSDEDTSISLANPGEKLYDFLFTRDNIDDKKLYSNFSITNKKEGKTKYSNVLEKLKNGLTESNIDIKNFRKDFKNLLKNYYKGRYFKTSSLLFKDIILDVIKEAKNINSIDNYEDFSLCQYLYFNIFLDKSNKEACKTVTRRFLKKALEKSNNFIYGSIDSEIKEFKYDNENISLEKDYSIEIESQDFDYNINNSVATKIKENQRKYNDTLANTSKSLKIINNSVFSSENLNKISKKHGYEKINSISIRQSANEIFKSLVKEITHSSYDRKTWEKYKSDFNRSREEGMNDNMFMQWENESDYNEEGKLQLFLDDIEGEVWRDYFYQLDKALESADINVSFELTKCFLPFLYFQDRCIISKNQPTARHITGFLIESVNSESILYQIPSNILPGDRNITVTPNLKENQHKIRKKLSIKANSKSNNNNFIELHDNFDEIIDFDSSSENFNVFNSITKKLLDLIKTADSDFDNKEFKSEIDIDNYINDNPEIMEISLDIIEVYSNIYCYYIEMINQETSIRVLSNNKNYSSNDNNSYFYNILRSYNIKDLERINNISSRSNLSFMNEEITRYAIKNLENITSSYDENVSLFIGNQNITINENKDKFSSEIEKTLRYLTTSDTYQSISFDLLMHSLNFFLKTTDKILFNELSQNIRINSIDYNPEKLLFNFNDSNYMNIFYNRKEYLNYYNTLFENKSDIFVKTPDDLLNFNIFDIENIKETKNIINLNNDFRNFKVTTGDLYSVCLNMNDLETISKNSFIKLKIEIVDHSRLDRVFIPKIFYFSPLIFDYSFTEKENINSVREKVGYYLTNNRSNERLAFYNLEDLKNNKLFMKKVVEKFNISNVDISYLTNEIIYDLITEDIYENHKNSFRVENVIESLYNIKLSEIQLHDTISIDTYNLVKNKISNNEFFDIFETNKDFFFDESFTLNNLENNYTISSKHDKHKKIVAFIKRLNNLISTSNDGKILNMIDNYVNLNFNININDFLFIINNKDTTLEDKDNNTQKIENTDDLNSHISDIDIIKYNIEKIDVENLKQNGLYKFKREAATQNIDSYSITVSTEVI